MSTDGVPDNAANEGGMWVISSVGVLLSNVVIQKRPRIRDDDRRQPAEGIDVQTVSAIPISNTTIVRDNQGFDLRCAPMSQASGGADGVARIQCPGFNRAPDPTPQGPPQ